MIAGRVLGAVGRAVDWSLIHVLAAVSDRVEGRGADCLRRADALADVEADVDHLEPGQLCATEKLADQGLPTEVLECWACGCPASRHVGNAGIHWPCEDCGCSDLLIQDSEKRSSAAVVAPAADNTTDCGCGSGNKCPDPIVCPDAVDGVGLVDSMEAAYHYHKPVLAFSASTNREGWAEVSKTCWRCEGCSWTGPTEQAHARHRFQVLADMKAATNRVTERLGGAS